jgi:serine/threonine protein kinase
METPSGKLIGRYNVVAELGRGSMGAVYKAWDPKIERFVAIKTILLHLTGVGDQSDFRKRFFIEAQAAGRLLHPGIVAVFDVGEDEKTSDPYIVMEYVEGGNLGELLARNTTGLEVDEALEITQQIAEALDYAHAQGVVHRDIKPANILIPNSGQAKIGDFGIAQLDLSHMTLPGQVLGTPAFMSPEQLEGEQVDGRSDLFSLGAILYSALTGFSPFQGNNAASVCFKVANRQPLKATVLAPQLPPELDAVIARALAKDPAERYQRGVEFAEDLVKLRSQAVKGRKKSALWFSKTAESRTWLDERTSILDAPGTPEAGTEVGAVPTEASGPPTEASAVPNQRPKKRRSRRSTTKTDAVVAPAASNTAGINQAEINQSSAQETVAHHDTMALNDARAKDEASNFHDTAAYSAGDLNKSRVIESRAAASPKAMAAAAANAGAASVATVNSAAVTEQVASSTAVATQPMETMPAAPKQMSGGVAYTPVARKQSATSGNSTGGSTTNSSAGNSWASVWEEFSRAMQSLEAKLQPIVRAQWLFMQAQAQKFRPIAASAASWAQAQASAFLSYAQGKIPTLLTPAGAQTATAVLLCVMAIVLGVRGWRELRSPESGAQKSMQGKVSANADDRSASHLSNGASAQPAVQTAATGSSDSEGAGTDSKSEADVVVRKLAASARHSRSLAPATQKGGTHAALKQPAVETSNTPLIAAPIAPAATDVAKDSAAPAPIPVHAAPPDSNMEIRVANHFADASLSVWVDDTLAYQHILRDGHKKTLLVLGLGAKETVLIPLSSGKHDVRVQVQSAAEKYDETRSITGDFPKSLKKPLSVNFDKHTKEMRLEWGADASLTQ